MNAMKTLTRWMRFPEFWAVALPLVMAVGMGVTTIVLAVSNPDPQVPRSADAVR